MARPLRAIRAALLHRHRDESGKVQFLTIVLIAALVGGAYWAWVALPVYLDHLHVKPKCEEALINTIRFRNTRRTQEDLYRRLHGIRSIERVIGGEVKTVPAIDPPEDHLNIRLDQSVRPAILSIQGYYAREVDLPLLDRTHTFHFNFECERPAG